MDRLAALRARLKDLELDGFIVPNADRHLSEYLPPEDRRLAWLSGFEGSAGTGLVLADRAALVTDGRYRVQASAELDPALWELIIVPDKRAADWLSAHAAGQRLGYDPWTVSPAGLERLLGKGVEAVPLDDNPIDALWHDRPPVASSRPFAQPLDHAGQAVANKLEQLGAAIAAAGADAAVLTALDSIAWAFNLRGSDLAHTPVARAWALVHASGSAVLWIDGLESGVLEAGAPVEIRPYGRFAADLGRPGARRILFDRESSPQAVARLLEGGGAQLVFARDPVVGPRARKNAAEAAGARAAHRRDGVAMVRFLHWFDTEAPGGRLSEASAAVQLETFRRQSGLYRGPSFETIAAWGANAAIVHYRVTPRTDRALEGDGLFLLDSGAQYPDGTTDITRTLALGTPPPEAIRAATLVLKGHIALARQRFPRGVRGIQLDALARQHLWAAGLDYAHGTGHGVGSYLSVHEGPQRIAASAAFSGGDEPLAPGMILSNEPGHYVEGAYGVRLENLMLVVEAPAEGDEQPMLGFETLTLAPFDRRLIDAALLAPDERAWLDAYHAQVVQELGPLVDEPVRAWLARACEPFASS